MVAFAGDDNLSDRAGSVSPLNTSYDRVSTQPFPWLRK